MKNAIILSCSTGQGHNSCAEAIKEFFEKKNISCRICESLDFVSPGFARLVSWGHSFMYKHIPALFRWGYRYSERHRSLLERGSVIDRLLRRGSGRLYEFLAAGGYDTVICTHMFAALALTQVLESHPMELLTAFVATDYTFCPGTEICGVQRFFIPCDTLTGAYRDRAMPGKAVTATGIPVRETFWVRQDRERAKELLHIGGEHRHLLVMCGSMGCGPLVRLVRRITHELPAGVEVTVICGTNERLREKLSGKYRRNSRIHVVGYTDKISLYMDSADLYLTKPGGISVTEAAAKCLPMAFIDAVSGCERYNMDFFTNMGAAITDPSVRKLARKCIGLLGSEAELLKMRRALEAYGQPNGAELIFRDLSRGSTL